MKTESTLVLMSKFNQTKLRQTIQAKVGNECFDVINVVTMK